MFLRKSLSYILIVTHLWMCFLPSLSFAMEGMRFEVARGEVDPFHKDRTYLTIKALRLKNMKDEGGDLLYENKIYFEDKRAHIMRPHHNTIPQNNTFELKSTHSSHGQPAQALLKFSYQNPQKLSAKPDQIAFKIDSDGKITVDNLYFNTLCIELRTFEDLFLEKKKTLKVPELHLRGRNIHNASHLIVDKVFLKAKPFVNGLLNPNYLKQPKGKITNASEGKILTQELHSVHEHFTNQGKIHSDSNLKLDLHLNDLLNEHTGEGIQNKQFSRISAIGELSILNGRNITNNSLIKAEGKEANCSIQTQYLLNAHTIESEFILKMLVDEFENRKTIQAQHQDIQVKTLHNHASINAGQTFNLTQIPGGNGLHNHKGGTISSNGKLVSKAEWFSNNEGATFKAKNLEVIGDMAVNRGEMEGTDSLNITLDTLNHQAGKIKSGKESSFNISGKWANNAPVEFKNVKLGINHLLNQNTIKSETLAGDIKHLENLNNIHAKKSINLGIDVLDNQNDIICDQILRLTLLKTGLNTGTLQGDLHLTIQSLLINQGELKNTQGSTAQNIVFEGDGSVLNQEQGSTTSSNDLVFNMKGFFLNKGTTGATSLLGNGKFYNHNILNIRGTKETPFHLGVKHFSNFIQGKIQGEKENYIILTDQNTSFFNIGTLVLDGFDIRRTTFSNAVTQFKNKGTIKAKNFTWLQKYQLGWGENSGVIETDTFSIIGKPVYFTNASSGTLKVKEELTSRQENFVNEGDIQVGQKMSLVSGKNNGTIGSLKAKEELASCQENSMNEGDIQVGQKMGLVPEKDNGTLGEKAPHLDVQNFLENTGGIKVVGLSGAGKVDNQGSLKFSGGTQKAPSRMSIATFINGLEVSSDIHNAPRSQLMGSYIQVTPQNQRFIAQYHSEIVAKSFVVEQPLTPLTKKSFSSTTFENHGTVETNILKVNRKESLNTGWIQASSFFVKGRKFDNAPQGFLHIREPKKSPHVKQSIKSRVAIFNNNGKMIVDEGKFSQKKGEFNNFGTWDHLGDINLGVTCLTNNETGTLIWQDGHFSFTPQHFVNKGNWTLDRMVCNQPLNMHNRNILHLQGGQVTFERLINDHILGLSAGQYEIIEEFQNNHVLDLLKNDWAFTDDSNSTARHRLVLKGKAYEGYIPDGEIVAEQSLIYDVQTFPKKINVQGDIEFSPRHRHNRTLADLLKISAFGKVSFFCMGGSIDQDYEGRIGHLFLGVDGPFTTHYSFKTKILTLNATGVVTCGASNTNMGIIAATEGPLNLTGSTIDGRFGKFFGKGETNLYSTVEDILVGAEEQGEDKETREFYNSVYKNWCGGWWFWRHHAGNHSTGIRNGAYVTSGDSKVTLKSARDILVNFGEVRSETGTLFIAENNIQNLASRFLSRGTTDFHANDYNHLRKTPVGKSYILSHDYPGSDPAIIQSAGNVNFYVKNILNRASTIRSGGSIFVNNNALSKEAGYTEVPLHYYYLWFNGTGWGTDWGWKQGHLLTHSCITQANDIIQINRGDCIITGSMSASNIKMQSTGDVTFHNTSRSRKTTVYDKPFLINITEMTQEEARGNGILKLMPNGEIQSDFALARAFQPQLEDVVTFEGGFPIPRNTPFMDQIFNPLSNINLDLIIQSQFSKVAGRVLKGKDVDKVLWKQAGKWRQQSKKAIMTEEDMQSIKRSMLVKRLKKIGSTLQEDIILCIAPNEVNAFQDQGDFFAENKFECISDGDQTHLNDRVVSGPGGIDVGSHKKMKLATESYTVSHETKHSKTTQTLAMPKQQFITAGNLNGFGDESLNRIATDVLSGENISLTSKMGGVDENMLSLPTTVETRKEERTGWFSNKTTSESNTTTSVLSCTTQGEKSILRKGETGISQVGSKDQTNGTSEYDSPNTRISSGLTYDIHQKTTEEDGFSNKTTFSMQQIPKFEQATIKALNIIFKGKATLEGVLLEGDKVFDKTDSGLKMKSQIGEVSYSQDTTYDNPLSYGKVGCRGGYEVECPTTLMVNQIIRALDENPMILENVNWDKDRTQIIGKFEETTYQLKKWHEEYAQHHQVISKEALVVVALAIALATKGAGVKVFSSLLKGITATTGLQLSSMGVAMFNAGFTSICTQMGASFLQNGNPMDALQSICSSQYLKNFAVTVATAGAVEKIGTALELQLDPKKMGFLDYAKKNGLEFTIKAPLNSIVCGESVSESLRKNGASAVVNTVAEHLCNEIGKNFLGVDKPQLNKIEETGDLSQQGVSQSQKTVEGKLSYGERNLLHGMVGAGTGLLLNLDDPLRGAISGAAGAVLSEILADNFIDQKAIKKEIKQEALKNGETLSFEEINKRAEETIRIRTDFVRMANATILAVANLDTSTGILTSNNALDNNFLPSMTKNLLLAKMHPEEEEERYNELFEDVYEDPQGLYFQMALEKTFPNEKPSRLRVIGQAIKKFKQENAFIDPCLEGIGLVLYYSLYTTAAVSGFAVGGPAGATLKMAMVKSLEAPANQIVQYGVGKFVKWYESGGSTEMARLERKLGAWEFIEGTAPLLEIARIKGFKGGKGKNLTCKGNKGWKISESSDIATNVLQRVGIQNQQKLNNLFFSFVQNEHGGGSIGKGFGKRGPLQVKSEALSSSTLVKDRKIEILIPCKSFEEARNKALQALGEINEATRTPIKGRLKVGKDRIVGFRSKVGELQKEFRVDYDPITGTHINISVGKGNSRKKTAFQFPGTEEEVTKIIKRLERDKN